MTLDEANDYFKAKCLAGYSPKWRIQQVNNTWYVSITLYLPSSNSRLKVQPFYQNHRTLALALDLLKLGFEKWEAEKKYWSLRNS